MESQIPETPSSLHSLHRYKHIAIVGISEKPDRPSYSIALYMQEAGYDIIPINPRYAGKTLLGKHVYASLTEAKSAGEQIEIVDVFRKAEDTPPVAEEAIAIGANMLWLQLGIRNAETARQTREAGLEYAEDSCIKIEHMRLS